MSSGNPFRVSQAFSQPAQTLSINTDRSSSVLEARRGDSDHVLEDAAAQPTKTKKSVRILSPTTTIPPHPDVDDEHVTLNELMARRSSQGRPASPPPPVAPASFANNAITAGEANAQVVGKDAMATADALPGPRPYLTKPQAASSPGIAPVNPFSKTLAPLEPQDRESGTEERAHAQRPAPRNSRASLDVEGFKNLLMTGNATPRASGQSAQSTGAPQPTSGAQFESSSSTDTSSASRQSLFEHTHEAHAESPRTSVDMAESDDDESMGLVSEVKKGKKKPPPAPKTRHGKLVAPRQPQTVSFDSFEVTGPAPPPDTRRTDSWDVNRPLPPTPNVQLQQLQQQAPHISSQDTTPLQSPPASSRPSEASKPSEGRVKPKKTPPPVPLARRQSQLKTTTTGTGNRSRSSSNLTVSSQHSIEAPQTPTATNYDPMSSAKSPPPPPPSRYGARLANVGNSSAHSSTELASSSNPARTPRSVPDPPSPRRSVQHSEPSSPAPSVHRASSISSNRNTPRNVSGGSPGSNMPPPPPPRRRQSNRSSLDQQRPYANTSSSPTESRRTSTEHRRTSVASESSLRREYAPVDEDKAGNENALYSPQEESDQRLGLDQSLGADKDAAAAAAAGGSSAGASRSDSSTILDDMDKFQQEIEALRTRYTTQKG